MNRVVRNSTTLWPARWLIPGELSLANAPRLGTGQVSDGGATNVERARKATTVPIHGSPHNPLRKTQLVASLSKGRGVRGIIRRPLFEAGIVSRKEATRA